MNLSLSLSRRVFVLGGVGLVLPLAGCGQGFDMSTRESLKSSFASTVDSLERSGKNNGLMFGHALFRAANPVVWESPGDDFDPLKLLRSVVDRGIEPEIGSDAYLDSVWKGRNNIAGLDPRGVVRLYVVRDKAALKEQLDWINGFEARARLRKSEADFDAKRRDGLIARITPSKSGYHWTFSEPRAAVIDFSLYNPLDRPISGIDFAVDLIAPSGAIAGSGLVKYRPFIPIAIGVGGSYQVDVSNIVALADPRFMDLKDPLAASMKISNVYVGDGESVVSPPKQLTQLEARRTLIRRLKDDISGNIRNLFLYRKAFF